MRRGPVARAMRGGLARRRVQTIVIGLVVLASTAASVLALALVVDSDAPFDHAFAAQRGADVVAAVNPARATNAQLAAARRLPEVTAAAGPFAEATVAPRIAGPVGCGPSSGEFCRGETLPLITLAGRASPGGPVDDLTLQSGHWADRPGQLVLDSSQSSAGIRLPLGTKVTVGGAAGRRTLTVVGIASSVTGSADGWVAPGEIAGLRTRGAPASAELMFRFRSSASAADLRADVAAVTHALPAGTITGTQSYLAAKALEAGNIAPFVPFLLAFGVIGMVMSALIVTNVVTGAVVAGYRRIGVLKSIGFTPGQVVAAYTGQVMVPAIAGCLGGLVLGNVLAVPVLAQTADAYGVGALTVPAWVDAVVPVVICGVVGVAALLPALRAGRLSAVQAIAIGRAPRTGRGYAAHRLLGRLPLPRAATIGLAAPFARPARTMVTLAAILLGATTVTLAVGLSTSLNRVADGLSHAQSEPVQIVLPASGPFSGFPAARPGRQPTASQAERAVQAALRAQPGTLRYVAEADRLATVAGLSQPVSVSAFSGNASWTGYDLISGHWYTGPDQVDVPMRFLTVTGKAVGDTITLISGSRQITVRIVGQVFDTTYNGLHLLTDRQTLASIVPGLTPNLYDVALQPGTNPAAYARAVGSKLGSGYGAVLNDQGGSIIGLMISLIGTLTLLLAIVAGLGVLNTVLLNTRERAADLGVFKAVGMTPRQTIAMVMCWVAGTGLVAGLIAVPAGIALHRVVLPAMANSADVGLPPSFLTVYGGWEIAGLALAGVAIAAAGALLPAGWAAGIRTATALRAE